MQTHLQHLLPVQANEVFIRLGDASLAFCPLMLCQQASQVNVAIFQHHVYEMVILNNLSEIMSVRGAQDIAPDISRCADRTHSDLSLSSWQYTNLW